jgi:hypothetical protein
VRAAAGLGLGQFSRAPPCRSDFAADADDRAHAHLGGTGRACFLVRNGVGINAVRFAELSLIVDAEVARPPGSHGEDHGSEWLVWHQPIMDAGMIVACRP